MRHIRRICFLLIIFMFSFLIGCDKSSYDYILEDCNLVVLIDGERYDVGEVDLSNYKKAKDAYSLYKILYPSYIGTSTQFYEDVIKNRLFEGDAVLSVSFNINGTIKNEMFYRGDNISFPRVSLKDYNIIGWKYNDIEIDDSFIVVDDMEVEAITEKYINASVSVVGRGTARLDKTKVKIGDSVRIIYTAEFGYKLSRVTCNNKDITLSDNDTFVVIDDSCDICVYFDVEELSLPIMNIDFNSSLSSVNKTDYVNAKMSISNTLEKYEFDDELTEISPIEGETLQDHTGLSIFFFVASKV